MDEIEQFVIDHLKQRAVSAKVESTTRLMEEGILDSIALMGLVTHAEQAFGFALPDSEFVPENFETPASIAALIRRVK